jgi:4-amino-4-deoxy-L-arabinose transferase-like glycosyltransferase
VAARRPRPELAALTGLTGLLNLWALGRNGWANDYYSAAVRSMSSSWHDFLFASLDKGGVMTVDKPPLALWVQSLSVRVFGYHPLSVLVPQALMGVASVVLVYDLVRRRFGRVGGFVAGLALATTPITVGISRHNNPDALLVLCCVAALWFAVRALEDGRTRWLLFAGVCVGLGFETKMGVALTVLPGIAAAWLWLAPRGRGRLDALRQLLAGGVAMAFVGGAWPALVELTPAAERPWVSGTSDNSVLSLIFGYNGLGRVEGQSGVPGGGGANMSGGTPGPLRLLSAALGGQVGWLLGFAVLSGLGILLASRLRRSDPRTGWMLAVGGAFLTTAILFSAASGIFHPYYVSLLAPFLAALVGAGAAQLIGGELNVRILGPLALAAGVAGELVVQSRYPGQLPWLPGALIAVGALAALALVAFTSSRVRVLALAAALAALMVAPSVWAVDTLGYATNGTFPSGGPASVQTAGGGPFGGFAGRARLRRLRAAGLGGVGLFGPGGAPGAGPGGPPAGGPPGGSAFGGGPRGPGALGGGAGPAGAGEPFGQSRSLSRILSYVERHGGGTIAVSSQSSASRAIIEENAGIAGIGGFSGRESDVSVSWLAQEVRMGKIRWVLAEQGGAGGGAGLPGDTRAGSRAAMAAAVKACRAVAGGASPEGTLYDCQGRAAALLGASAQQSPS